MQRDLRGDDVGEDARAVADDSGGRFIARAFDAEHKHGLNPDEAMNP
jgi:hypothetical protein